MIYQYIHDDTNEIIEVEMPMADDKPRTIERNGKSYRFMWPFEDQKRAAIHIPLDFGSSENSINYDRRPSGKKRLF